MDKWGTKLHAAVKTVSEMAALGMGLDRNAFIERLEGGAHLLGPTGSDLVKNDVGAIFAGFHYDIAFLSIHGKSRYPGLFVWLRNDQKLQVKVPSGCLLLQAGKLFEHITGGYVLPGFHEVVYTQQTKEMVTKAISEGKIPWRVSSTMFTHFRYNVDCSPMPELSHLWGPDKETDP
jgi:isopenicillin N synthase-like dioxygenase